MSWFSNIKQGNPDKIPERIVLMGPPGAGKTSAAISFPASVHVEVEPSLDAYPTQPRFERPEKWQHVEEITDEILKRAKAGNLGYQTVIYDTLDALEQHCWDYTCGDNYMNKKWNSIETPGWEKGQKAAMRHWRAFSAQLDLITEMGINIVLTCHSAVGKFKNPDGIDFNRYVMKLHTTASHHWFEWASDVFFLTHDFGVQTLSMSNDPNDKKKAIGQSTSTRMVYTTWDAAHDAKHRRRLPTSFKLPDPMKGGSFFNELEALRQRTAERLLAGEDVDE